MYAQLDTMRTRLAEADEGLDYNRLTFEEKQAAQALVEAREAKFVAVSERTRVVRHTPNALKSFLTMGAFA